MYKEQLEKMFNEALEIQKTKYPERAESHHKVAAIVAVGALRDSLTAIHGANNIPLEALLAMRDLMNKTNDLVYKTINPV